MNYNVNIVFLPYLQTPFVSALLQGNSSKDFISLLISAFLSETTAIRDGCSFLKESIIGVPYFPEGDFVISFRFLAFLGGDLIN